MLWIWLDALGAVAARLVRWLAGRILGRAILAVLGVLAAGLAVFAVGMRQGRGAERAKQEGRAARTLEKRRQAENEVRDLGKDELVRRAARWVRH